MYTGVGQLTVSSMQPKLGLAPLTISQLQLIILPPPVQGALDSLRKQLKSEAQLDRLQLCTTASFKAQFHPKGIPAACAAQQVIHDASRFRQGVRNTFEYFKSQNQQAYAKQLLTPLVNMVVAETDLSAPDAHRYIGKDYVNVMAEAPVASKLVAQIGWTQQVPVEPEAKPGACPPGTIGIPPACIPAVCPPGTTGTFPNCVPVGDQPPPPEPPRRKPEPGKKPPYVLYAGIGAVVLLGAVYLATRRR